MFTCILCQNEFDENKKTQEHIFPDSIGGTISLWDLCKKCNDHLGRFVDSPLVNNWFIASHRLVLKIRGKSGKIPNPLSNGILANDSTKKIQYKLHDGLPDYLYLVPNVNRWIDENGNRVISIVIDKSDENKLPHMLDLIKERISKEKGRVVETKNIKKQEGKIEQPVIKQQKFIHNYDWQRCILKIAYELTYRMIGSEYLNDPIANKIRSLLIKEKVTQDELKQSRISGEIGFAAENKGLPFFNDPNSLYAMTICLDSRLVCNIKIFNIFSGLIAVSSHNYGKQNFEGSIIRIDVKNNKKTELPFLEYLENLVQV
jgi:hypothetical protein